MIRTKTARWRIYDYCNTKMFLPLPVLCHFIWSTVFWNSNDLVTKLPKIKTQTAVGFPKYLVASVWTVALDFWLKGHIMPWTIPFYTVVIACNIQLVHSRCPLTAHLCHVSQGEEARFPFWGHQSEQVTPSITHFFLLNCWSALNYADGIDRKALSEVEEQWLRWTSLCYVASHAQSTVFK